MTQPQQNPLDAAAKAQGAPSPAEVIAQAISNRPVKTSKKGTVVVEIGGDLHTVPKKLAHAITHLMTEYETNIKLANEIETNRIGILAAAQMLLKQPRDSERFDEAMAFLKTKVEEAGT